LFRSHQAGLPLFFLYLLVVTEDARQIGALPLVEGSPYSHRLLGRLTGTSDGKHWERVLGAAAAPGIHHHPVGDSIDLGDHVRHPPQGLRRSPHPAAHTSATFQIADLLGADMQAVCTTLAS
jgi:hypothetical protein